MGLLDDYEKIVGHEIINQLRQIARRLNGLKVVHVNSTRYGGGVAEILTKMIPLQQALGLEVYWETIKGTPEFFQCTKLFHNGMQGKEVLLTETLLDSYVEANRFNAEELRNQLEDADFVFIHDPQPAALIKSFPNRKGKWIWRCHIDASTPHRSVWKYLHKFVSGYDASIFSLADFVQHLPHPIYIIPPSIDPLSDKNIELPIEEINTLYERYAIDPDRPFILQVSRFDYFKDPLGVIESFRLAKKFRSDLQLVLAGGGAADDPEGEAVLNEVNLASSKQKDIHILYLPSDAHRTINALQRAATIVLQKSIREGFGLTVTEALWKGKPVIGGNTGGIRLQVVDHYTGFLVNSPEGAALRIRYLLENPEIIDKMGLVGRDFIKENFLITRQLRDNLTLMTTLLFPEERLELNKL